MTFDERDIQGQDSQEVEVEGYNDHIWWGIAQRNLFDREKALYNKLLFAGYLRDILRIMRFCSSGDHVEIHSKG